MDRAGQCQQEVTEYSERQTELCLSGQRRRSHEYSIIER